MAKWGEGDPRWIVEERPDATNVNNWHWTEKNADQWSKNKLKDLFANLAIEDPKIGNVVIEDVDKIEGEARVNNRKGKLIFFYEWEISLKWKGCVNGKDTEVKGKVDIPNLSEEHEDMKDVDVDVSLTTKGPEADILKEMMRVGVGAKRIRECLADYLSALKNEYSHGVILPKKGTENGSVIPPQSKAPAANAKSSMAETEKKMGNVNITNSCGVRIEVDDLRIEESMKCTGQELYNALTQRDMIQIFTGGPAKMADAAEANGAFELLGGSISGKFLEVAPFTKIVQEWRLKTWPAGHFSTVTITLKQTKEDTKLTLVQKAVPVKEIESTRQGWHRYYFESMKRSFGFGAVLF